jgi:hypothetical protein
MSGQIIFIQPQYESRGKNGDIPLFNYRRSELAINLLNQNGVISNTQYDSTSRVMLLEAIVNGERSPIVITPTKEDIGKYGILINSSPEIQVTIEEFRMPTVLFSLRYDKKLLPESDKFMFGDTIEYQLNLKPML